MNNYKHPCSKTDNLISLILASF
uniref:Uncharacterized protein n=1 Tax=Rhizophora mucronata TaxID=61149 RepID=A0A2P2PH79_RHIMU